MEHKEEEFRKEMEKRDRDLLKKLQLSHEAFYNNQVNRSTLGTTKRKGFGARRKDKGEHQWI